MDKKSIAASLVIAVLCASGQLFAQTPVPPPKVDTQAMPVPPPKPEPAPTSLAMSEASKPASTPTPAAPTAPKCDAQAYRSLVGRTISDILTMQLPQGTRIYRIGDPLTAAVNPGKLNIELNRGTRVARVYCS
jgi:hypothetical protein